VFFDVFALNSLWREACFVFSLTEHSEKNTATHINKVDPEKNKRQRQQPRAFFGEKKE
jgi:hypothetical protein